MSKRIPIEAAKQVAEKYDKDQVIILTWDREYNVTSVTTYGKTQIDCEQAARGGNNIKRLLKWPEELCNDQPARIRRKNQKEQSIEKKDEPRDTTTDT